MCYYLKERSEKNVLKKNKALKKSSEEKERSEENEADLFFAVTFTLVKYSGRRRA